MKNKPHSVKFCLIFIGILSLCSCDNNYLQDRVATILTLKLSSNAIHTGQQLTLSGTLAPLRNDETTNLQGTPVHISIKSDDGYLERARTTVINNKGFYEITLSEKFFTSENSYIITTSFPGSTSLQSSNSAEQALRVGNCAGYAIIFQGTPTTDRQIFLSHSKSSSHVYQTLLALSLLPDNIQLIKDDNNVNDSTSLLQKFRQALSQIAEKMREQPAPLSIIIISKGSEGVIQAGSVKLTTEALANMLEELELSLSPENNNIPLTLFLATPHSGSFIPGLSAKNRIIITSCQSDEYVWPGALAENNIRYGDFFIQEIFANLAQGFSLNAAFKDSSKATVAYTRSGTKPCDTQSEFSLQHPLLDDNGDQTGSTFIFAHPVAAEDGIIAASWYLGFGNKIQPEDNNRFPVISEVTATKTLSEEDKSTLLWIKSNVNVEKAWVEIRSPGIQISRNSEVGKKIQKLRSRNLYIDQEQVAQKPLPSQSSIEQLPPVSVVYSMTYDDNKDIWQTTVPEFNEFGMYEARYYVSKKETGAISAAAQSFVFRSPAGRQPPPPANLFFPPDQAQVTTTGQLFSWQPVSAEDVTYILEISATEDPCYFMKNLVFRHEGIKNNTIAVDLFHHLQYGKKYLWRVRVRDCFGLSSEYKKTKNNIVDVSLSCLPQNIKKYFRRLWDSDGIGFSTAYADTGTLTNTMYYLPGMPGFSPISGIVTGYLDSLNCNSPINKSSVSSTATPDTTASSATGFYSLSVPLGHFGELPTNSHISSSNLGHQTSNINITSTTINFSLSRNDPLFNAGMSSISAGTGSETDPVIIETGIPTLQWDCISGADKYRVEITASTGQSTIHDNIFPCSYSMTAPCDSSAGLCSWRFQPYNSTQIGPWSNEIYFWHIDTDGDNDIDGTDIANIIRFHTIDGIILAKLANAL